MKPTVWIVNKGSHDFEKAKEFGQIRYLHTGFLNPFAVSVMYRIIEQGLEDSKPEDYLLPTGLPIMNLVAGALFAVKHGRLNLLIHKMETIDGAKVSNYIHRSIVFGEEEGNE